MTASLTTGTFAPTSEYIARSGYNATVNHSGGINGTANTYQISIGYGAGLTGTYNLSGTGTLSPANSLIVGGAGTGILNQSGGSADALNLYVGNLAGSSGTYNLSSGSLTVVDNIFSANEFIGNSGTGSLVQTGGTNTVSYLYLGYGVGSSGNYDLSAGTLTSYRSYVGLAGTGVFNHSGGSHSTVDFFIGASGAGTYNLSGTGSLTTSFEWLGGDSGTNVFNQSGGTSDVTFGSSIGYGGDFTFNQTGGTRTVGLSSMDLGVGAGYAAVYNLRGGTLAVNADTAIGNGAGSGTLNLDGGTLSVGSASGSVNVDTLNIGSAAAYNGSHTLSGAGRSVTVGTMNVGLGGTGTFTQTSGTTTVAGTLAVAANAGSAGTINLQGGSLTAAILINKDTVNFSGGTLSAAIDNYDSLNLSGGGTRSLSGTLTNNGIVDVAAGTTAEFNGLVDGAGDFTGGGTSVFKGGFSPGNSPALVTIDGDAVFDAGNSLVMELAGLTPGSQFDVLDISGDAWLDGTLDIDFLSGFNPVAGNSFDLILADVLHGTFGTTLLPGLDPGLLWNLQYLLNPTGDDIVRLSVESAAVVPVPAAAWLFGSALGLMGAVRRKISS